MSLPRVGRPALVGLLLLAVLALAALGEARPGGGETFGGGGGGSGRSSDGGGGSSGGGGDLAFLFFLLRLCWEHPLVGVPVLFFFVAFLAFSQTVHATTNWDSAQPTLHTDVSASTAPSAPPPSVEPIARVDPEFSAILFEDFLFRLYATAHRARGERRLDELAPYIGPRARQALAYRPPSGTVTGVVVGALHVRRVDVPETTDATRADAVVTVRVEFEANYSVGAGEGSRRFVIEDWVLERSVSARTRPPEPGRRFTCPNCGAPWRTAEAAGTQKCSSCGEVVDNGRFDWQVTGIHLRQERTNIPGLDQDVPERGTSAPTKRDPQFSAQMGALLQADPALSAAALEARLRHVYTVVNDAWAQQDLGPARAVLSDGLADYLQYWLDAYAQQQMRNVLADMRLTRHTLVKLRRDRHYDALTVRIWATGKDYVVRTTDGSHVRGSQSMERAYSEYWTLIRAAGRRGAPRADATCGGCGAPLVVSMAGACSHCGAHLTAGEFDWVLSKIEQDDSYQG